MGCVGSLLPHGLGWPEGHPPTATGVTESLHRTALAENFLSRGLIFKQFTLQSSLCSAWGN